MARSDSVNSTTVVEEKVYTKVAWRLVPVHVDPHCAGFDRDSRLRGLTSCASLSHECNVDGDVIHRSCPDQQRVRRVGCTLIAVTASFNHEP
jgi:hypothetical protein